MRIIYMGTPDFAVPTLKSLKDAGHEIALVVVQPDRPAGRGRKLTPPPVKVAAKELGLEVFQPENINEDEPYQRLLDAKPELMVVAAFGQILKKRVLAIPKLGCINLHSSLLPLFRGAAPMQRAIMEGFKETGATTMKMARKMDAGRMLLKEKVEITPTTTFGDLHDELATKGATLMVKTVELLSAGKLSPEAQDESQVTFAPKIEPAERVVNWENSAKEIDGKIRGLSPAPGAYALFKGKRIILLRSRLLEGSGSGNAGSISAIRDGQLEVDTGSGKLAILEVRPEGKKAMDAISWANGARIKTDSCFSIDGSS